MCLASDAIIMMQCGYGNNNLLGTSVNPGRSVEKMYTQKQQRRVTKNDTTIMTSSSSSCPLLVVESVFQDLWWEFHNRIVRRPCPEEVSSSKCEIFKEHYDSIGDKSEEDALVVCNCAHHQWQLSAPAERRCNWLRFMRLRSSTAVCWVLLLVLLLGTTSSLAAGNDILPGNGTEPRKKVICSSIDVRNHPVMLQRLNNCAVVEGFVQIVLIDKYDDDDFDNYSFPELTEITEYLVLFRVNGLKTLRTLFPNLAVVRGNSLVQNYAIVIYEVPHIEEVGLVSLTHISRGAVRIEKNPMLCFADTIDWDLITDANMVSYIQDNQKSNACPVCPTHVTYLQDGKNVTHECPKGPNAAGQIKWHCWNHEHCQKKCDPSCPSKACNQFNGCCSAECLGGCSDEPGGTKCDVCKDFMIGPMASRRCIDKCPDDRFVYNSRCVTAPECYQLNKPIKLETLTNIPMNPYIPFDKKCSMDCPSNHEMTVKDGLRTCKRCDGPCPRRCPGELKINNLQDIQKVWGCEIIVKSLEIQLTATGGSNVVYELEKGLYSLKEIGSYLKIVRSYPLLSLGFLKNLKVIHGEGVTDHSLHILGNQNLAELFDHDVRIKNGSMFFNDNPQLCVEKILKFRNFNNHIKLDNAENISLMNGDRAACNVQEIETEVLQIQSHVMVYKWKHISMEKDHRMLLGYTVYYIQADHKNVTIYDQRDACNVQGWKVEDHPVSQINQNVDLPPKIIYNLSPYTQYAYYIKAYLLKAEGFGAQSNITYFRTAPGTPSSVLNVDVKFEQDQAVVSWGAPKSIPGRLTHYEIYIELVKVDEGAMSAWDHCKAGLDKAQDETTITDPPVSQHHRPKEKDVCTQEDCKDYCSVMKTDKDVIDPDKADDEITFENYLHNLVYIKRMSPKSAPPANSSRRKRRAENNRTLEKFPNDEKPQEGNKSARITVMDVKGYYMSIFNTTNLTTISYPLKTFNHAASYTFAIKACRAKETSPKEMNDKENHCGVDVIIKATTPIVAHADDVLFETFKAKDDSNSTMRMIKVDWEAPKNPNGLILNYQIKYERNDLHTASPLCVQAKEFPDGKGHLTLYKLEAGNYTIRVRAVTLAGNGNYSMPRYVYLEKEETSPTTVITILVVVMVFVAVTGLIGVYWYKSRYLPMQNMRLIAQVNPDYAGVIYKVDEWEIEREHVIKLEELGQGSFGMVYKGILTQLRGRKENIPCAIKTVNENATNKERDSFLIEASVMKQFDTHHVVRLLGVVSQGDPTFVVMELMANGDLKTYLRNHRPEEHDGDRTEVPQPPTLRQLYQMAIEIADGMAYLSAKKFVHRDLAARNCMVANDMTVKIGDFGMTRDIYETDYYRKGTKGFLPVRWMAPESLKDGVFSSSSDVFSYGVVLWEMVTLAEQPYKGYTNDQVLRFVIEGGVMERPVNCPDQLYLIMTQCWRHRPSQRLTFMDIIEELLPLADERFREVSYYYSSEAQDLEDRQQQSQALMDDATTPLHQGAAGGEDADEDDDKEEEEDMGDMGAMDDEYSLEMDLVPNNGPTATIRSPHSPLR